MAIYPGAEVRLISKWNQVRMTRYRRMNLHVAVSNGSSLYGYFASTNQACSHFYVADDGTVEQYIDTKYRSAADGHGNDSTISVETEGGVTNVNGEKWTAAQVRSLAKLWAWARDEHGIKNQIAINTNTNANSEGLSWHRLGIKGNFDNRPGLASKSYGRILYSSSVGKECPGDAKINQIPEIFAIANGDKKAPVVKPAGSVKPKPKPKPKPSGTAIKKQTNKTRPNGSTTFPTDYEDLILDKDFGEITVGAFQILMHAIAKKYGTNHNKQWDGDWGKLSVMDAMEWLQGNGFYLRTTKGVKLVIDGDDGFYFWYEMQRFLRSKGFYNKTTSGVPLRLDGDPEGWTVYGLQQYLNTQN